MPIYEFICEECGETFEELVFSAYSTAEVVCPQCHSDLVRKLISSFAARIGSDGASLGSSQSVRSCNTGST